MKRSPVPSFCLVILFLLMFIPLSPALALSLPPINIPTLPGNSKISLPTSPPINLPKATLPPINIPKVTTPPINIPRVTVPPIRLPTTPLINIPPIDNTDPDIKLPIGNPQISIPPMPDLGIDEIPKQIGRSIENAINEIGNNISNFLIGIINKLIGLLPGFFLGILAKLIPVITFIILVIIGIGALFISWIAIRFLFSFISALFRKLRRR